MTSRSFIHRWLAVAVCLLFTSPASAIIRRHDVADSAYQTYNPAVVYIFDSNGVMWGSGTVIAPDWVLTSAQVIDQLEAAGNLDDAGVGGGDQVSSDPILPFGPGIKAIHRPDGWNGNLAAGLDVGLIQLNGPGLIDPMRRSAASVGSLVGDAIDLIGFGTTGTGQTGPNSLDGIQRRATNTIDGQGALLTGVYTGSPYSNNIVVTDFDGIGVANRWGSSTPTSREGTIFSDEYGAPWIASGLLAAVTSFGGSGNSPYPAFGYRDAAAATAVAPHNDWINQTMGGVNWNTRATSLFHNTAAWGDGRIPYSNHVQFSMPNVDDDTFTVINFDRDTEVGGIQVEFGRHSFNMQGHEFEATSTVTVDDDARMLVRFGQFSANGTAGLRVGHNGFGHFTQRQEGNVTVENNLSLGNTANGDGLYQVGLTGDQLDIQLTVGGTLSVGRAGKGLFVHNTGEVNTNVLYVGEFASASGDQSGRYVLQDGDGNVVTKTLEVGRAGTGRFEQHAGDVYVTTSHMRIGRESTGNGTYDIDDGRLRTANGLSIYVGFDGTGLLNQNGGIVEGSNSLELGVSAGSEGTYLAADGTATFASRITVGAIGNGRMEVSNNGSVAGPELVLARDSGALGEVFQSGGRVIISGNTHLTMSSNATANYHLSGGELSVVGAINFGPGTANFDFTDGTLHVGTFNGDLTNNGGTLAPGNSTGLTTVEGDYTQTAGTLQIELDSSNSDTLVVNGNLTVGGALDVLLLGGYMPTSGAQFDIVDWSGALANTFTSLNLPSLTGSLTWNTSELYTEGVLSVSGPVTTANGGDYNNDGIVNAADYTVWRNHLGQFFQLHDEGENASTGFVDRLDYNVWKANFGLFSNKFAFTDAGNGPAVPEPASWMIAVCALTVIGGRRLRG
ncbi:MAG: trypsin-like serine protease [Pirellulales bacterium]